METVYFTLTDADGDGTVETLDISSDDTDLGETQGGPLSGQMPRATGPNDDERITATTDVRLGPFYPYTVEFTTITPVTASITGKTWFTATVTGTDLDGDASAEDTFHAVLTDPESDGFYENLDL